MKKSRIISSILAALAFGQASVSAFERPKVYDLKPNDYVNLGKPPPSS